MPGRSIPLVNGQYYHVLNRGVNKQSIYSGAGSYRRFLKLIQYYQYAKTPISFSTFNKLSKDRQDQIWTQLNIESPKQVEIISFCLMPNHFHLLLKQNKEDGISIFMSKLQNGFTRFVNLKENRSGHLLQGQFKAVRVEDDEQLLHLNRYIHLNPYTSYLVKNIEGLFSYPWSSLKNYLNLVEDHITVKNTIISHFKTTESYWEFITDQADFQRSLDQVKHLALEY